MRNRLSPRDACSQKGIEAQGEERRGADSIYRICVPFPTSTSLGECQLLFADILATLPTDSAPPVYFDTLLQ